MVVKRVRLGFVYEVFLVGGWVLGVSGLGWVMTGKLFVLLKSWSREMKVRGWGYRLREGGLCIKL